MAGIRACGGVRVRRGLNGPGVRRGLAAALAMVVAFGAGAAGATAGVRTGPAMSRQEEQGPEEFARLVEQLDSPEYAAREQASIAIISDERITIQMVDEVLRTAELSPEQRERLRQVQRKRFDRSPRAAMGVQFSPLLTERVVLYQAFPPFKSAELLEPGDVIVSADGLPLHTARANDAMRMVIISHDPGEHVELVVRRGGETLEISLPLGSYAELPNGAPIGEAELERAFRTRLDRTRPPGRSLITTGVTMAEWKTMDEEAAQRRAVRDANMHRSGMTAVAPKILIAGGEPRPAFFDDGEMIKLMAFRGKDEFRADELEWIRQQQFDQQRRWAAAQHVPGAPVMTLEDEKARVTGEVQRLTMELQQIRAAAEAGAEIIPAQVQRMESDLKIAEKVLRALAAEPAEMGQAEPEQQEVEKPGP